MKRLLLLTALVVVGVLAVGAPYSQAAGGGTHRVLIRGTAYSFDNQDPIVGALIGARGAPGATAISDARGHYRLHVPARRKVTPYIQAEGFHSIFLQTFTTHHRTLRRVNFQVPTEQTFFALAALLHVQLDADGNLRRCAIVSTVNTRRVRHLTFRQFIAFGAHGVPGATAATIPSLGSPIYFNEHVIPDPSLTETSVDGGVIWTEVPRGIYTVKAKHPTKRFASFTATCRNGRIINANPPWGLHELRG